MLDGEEVQLTPKSLSFMVAGFSSDYVFTREHLLDQIWDSDYMGDADNVTVMVSRLREKIEKDPSTQNTSKPFGVWVINLAVKYRNVDLLVWK